jgi:hypothetical protein
VITAGECAAGLLAGIVLIFFALAPDAFQCLAEGLRDEIRSAVATWSPQRYRDEPIRTPRLWLAVLGIALIVLSVVTASSA